MLAGAELRRIRRASRQEVRRGDHIGTKSEGGRSRDDRAPRVCHRRAQALEPGDGRELGRGVQSQQHDHDRCGHRDEANDRDGLREAGAPRYALGITLGGTPAFCAAFRQAFDLD